MESSLSLTNSEKQGGNVREAGLGPATELEVELSLRVDFVYGQSTHTCHGRRERKNKPRL